jgi:hypothetical protein
MVTLLTPNTNSTDTEYRETLAIQEAGPKSGNGEMDQTFRPVVAESLPAPRDNSGKRSRKDHRNASFITGIAHPWQALYDLVSGPPLTRRDRHRRAIGEANVRSIASLSWFNRTSW